MQRPPLILGAALFGALALAEPADAACNPALANVPAGTAHIYDGVIGDTPARLALVFGKDGAIEGRYALATSTADIVVRGKLEPGSERFTLTETGADGKPRATFTGAFPEIEPAPPPSKSGSGGGFGGVYTVPGEYVSPGPGKGPDTNCWLVYGERQETGGASQRVKLNGARTIEHPSFGHLYAIAGVADDETINRRVQAFRQAIVDNRREEVVKYFRFPIAFTVNRQFVVIESERDLIKRYDEMFDARRRDYLAGLVPRLLQATETGVMLTVSIWLDKDGYIIAY